ncbi:16S rRNA (uracil(1498)-N(3))-methyltransferase [Sunxiuqinia dokdonensis]|uniref:Ribosomal RNA small subunit methyltransferase E n=1 Tax=Sunxiuqinia dokdonensis TaxID=1409788 RepID=A0A0L8VAA2_9BACT|nr:16S rRNA (uracil(1498)-N(3))-methyltransferase [Sunxiuqinia dokdonensis]KOH45122.1 16S rRNA methyltransferase [Sunxiuqinia dokdonensis]
MQLFYTPGITGPIFYLDETESKHAVRVLRLANGDKIELVDGKGNFFEAQIVDAHPKRCGIEVTKTVSGFNKRNHYIHLAVAPTKNIDRFEWFLEKATEIGVDEITPILCDHSERKVIKTERLEKVIISAMKQSLKAYLPKLNPLTPLKKVLESDWDGKRFIAHCYDQDKRELKNELASSQSNLILIGPEGDFSEEEIEIAIRNGLIPVSLGQSRLRTETAAVVACHTVNLLKS